MHISMNCESPRCLLLQISYTKLIQYAWSGRCRDLSVNLTITRPSARTQMSHWFVDDTAFSRKPLSQNLHYKRGKVVQFVCMFTPWCYIHTKAGCKKERFAYSVGPTHLHWASKETYHCFRAILTEIHHIKINHICYSLSSTSKTQRFAWVKMEKMQWNHKR